MKDLNESLDQYDQSLNNPIEMTVINDFSSDNIKYIISKFSDQIIYVENSENKVALLFKHRRKKAKGKYMVNTDSVIM